MDEDDRRAATGGARNPPSTRGESLRGRDAAEIRNEQRSGDPAFADERPDGPEPNETLRRVWSQPGGEAYNYRNAMLGAGGEAIGHDELTAAETPPENIRRVSDASLSGAERQPERDAGKAAATLGQEEGQEKGRHEGRDDGAKPGRSRR